MPKPWLGAPGVRSDPGPGRRTSHRGRPTTAHGAIAIGASGGWVPQWKTPVVRTRDRQGSPSGRDAGSMELPPSVRLWDSVPARATPSWAGETLRQVYASEVFGIAH
jgi:hypothetical protein